MEASITRILWIVGGLVLTAFVVFTLVNFGIAAVQRADFAVLDLSAYDDGVVYFTVKNIGTVPITGINVLKDPPYFRRRISELSRAFLSRYSHTLRDGVQMKEISEKEIEIVGGYEGPEYAVPSEEGIRLIRAFARCGLFLDPAYTGKAMLGLVRESAKGRWNESDNVLFIHTGGIFSLFPWRKELTTRT